MNIPETLKITSMSGLGKRPEGILQNQSNVVSLVLSLLKLFLESF
jgi:hypothetical protein